MPDFDTDKALAPKVFFIDPDPSVVSDSFIELAFFQGFEVYSISSDLNGDLKRKVKILVDTYPEILLFFTIDRKGSLSTWVEYLKELQEGSDSCVRIGVLYSKNTSAMDQLIQKTFNFEIGITGGCVPLEFSYKKNQILLLQVLEANQAMGRRKFIRMMCDSSYRVSFLFDEDSREALLVDLSISHFSVQFRGFDPKWEIGAKVKKVQLRLGGRLLMVSALLGIKRVSRESPVYVFLFNPNSSTSDFDDSMRRKLNLIICEYFKFKVLGSLRAQLEEAANSTSSHSRDQSAFSQS